MEGLEIPYAAIDLDWLRNTWPAPPDDPFNTALELENLAAVAANFRRAGVRFLVLAGVLDALLDRAQVDDVTVHVGDDEPATVAQEILRAVRWL